MHDLNSFLRDVLNLQVVQTSPHMKTYSGSPKGKNFEGDIALDLDASRREYVGEPHYINVGEMFIAEPQLMSASHFVAQK